ncbi:hypothetical protein HU200_033148 [Digitaria exilis]|uniref:Uncharacterized protein n=1 Tax=Digitaria exilis TaxID=1010633 RepID=A0A835BXC3_9POAL|nr:hypothetical protein HU200_033148 [Digitaria exilis]
MGRALVANQPQKGTTAALPSQHLAIFRSRASSSPLPSEAIVVAVRATSASSSSPSEPRTSSSSPSEPPPLPPRSSAAGRRRPPSRPPRPRRRHLVVAELSVARTVAAASASDLDLEGGDGEKVLGQAKDPQTPPDQIHQQPAQMEPPSPRTKDKDAQPAGTDPSVSSPEKKEAWEKAPKKPPPVLQKPASPPSHNTMPEMTRKQFTAWQKQQQAKK